MAIVLTVDAQAIAARVAGHKKKMGRRRGVLATNSFKCNIIKVASIYLISEHKERKEHTSILIVVLSKQRKAHPLPGTGSSYMEQD